MYTKQAKVDPRTSVWETHVSDDPVLDTECLNGKEG